MRVLVIANDFPYASTPQAGIFVLRQIQALRSLGWETRVLRFIPWAPPLFSRWKQYREVPIKYTYADIEVSVTRVLLLPRFGMMQYIGSQSYDFVARAISNFKPDLLHAHQIIPTGLLAIGHRCPVVVTAHGSDAYDYPYRNNAFQRVAKKVLADADRVVAVSRFIATHAERLGASKVQVVFNGADPAVFFPADRALARKKLKIPADRNVVVYVGYLGEAKGIFDLAIALRQLRELSPLILVAGSGEQELAMGEELRRHDIDHRFFGVLNQIDVAELVAASDIVTLPSHREGLPTTICEAMLSGRTVVATAVGGVPEIVSDGVTGFLVPPKEPATLAVALRDVFVNPHLRDDVGRKAYDYASSHLTWSANAAEYDRIFRELVDRRAQKGVKGTPQRAT